MDGWWAETYTPAVGWSIGDQHNHANDPSRDAAEAGARYALLEGDIASAFYTRDGNRTPTPWIARVRESMACLTPEFSSSRMVRQYLDDHYLPAGVVSRHRAAAGPQCGAQILAWRERLGNQWAAVRIVRVEVASREEEHAFQVHVDLGELNPAEVSVELYADALDGDRPVRKLMATTERSGNTWIFASHSGVAVRLPLHAPRHSSSSGRIDSARSALHQMEPPRKIGDPTR